MSTKQEQIKNKESEEVLKSPNNNDPKDAEPTTNSSDEVIKPFKGKSEAN